MHQPRLTMTNYIVVPFSTGPHGELLPGRTQNLIDRHQAILAAGKMSRYRAGVFVLEQIADLEGKRWPEPKLVAAFGRIPQDVSTPWRWMSRWRLDQASCPRLLRASTSCLTYLASPIAKAWMAGTSPAMTVELHAAML